MSWSERKSKSMHVEFQISLLDKNSAPPWIYDEKGNKSLWRWSMWKVWLHFVLFLVIQFFQIIRHLDHEVFGKRSRSMIKTSWLESKGQSIQRLVHMMIFPLYKPVFFSFSLQDLIWLASRKVPTKYAQIHIDHYIISVKQI